MTISTVCHLRECPQCFTHITASQNNRPQALSLMMDSERLKLQTHSTSKIPKLIAQLKNQSLRCSTRRTLMSNAKSVGLFPASKEVLEHLCLRMCALTIKGTLNQNIRSFLGAADPKQLLKRIIKQEHTQEPRKNRELRSFLISLVRSTARTKTPRKKLMCRDHGCQCKTPQLWWLTRATTK